jgi:hypothetical protein
MPVNEPEFVDGVAEFSECDVHVDVLSECDQNLKHSPGKPRHQQAIPDRDPDIAPFQNRFTVGVLVTGERRTVA